MSLSPNVQIPPRDLFWRLVDSLQETRIMAVHGYEEEPRVGKLNGYDALEVLGRARDVLEEAEELRVDSNQESRGD